MKYLLILLTLLLSLMGKANADTYYATYSLTKDAPVSRFRTGVVSYSLGTKEGQMRLQADISAKYSLEGVDVRLAHLELITKPGGIYMDHYNRLKDEDNILLINLGFK